MTLMGGVFQSPIIPTTALGGPRLLRDELPGALKRVQLVDFRKLRSTGPVETSYQGGAPAVLKNAEYLNH